MARAQAQYLRIFDTAGVTYERWQSYYATGAVTWDDEIWSYVPFAADGFTAGINVDDADISVTAPATRLVVVALEKAIRQALLVQLEIYDFDPTDGNSTPQEEQELIAAYIGQVTGGSSSLTNITVQLGSALSPVGSQVPPRKFTTYIMGMGCRL